MNAVSLLSPLSRRARVCITGPYSLCNDDHQFKVFLLRHDRVPKGNSKTPAELRQALRSSRLGWTIDGLRRFRGSVTSQIPRQDLCLAGYRALRGYIINTRKGDMGLQAHRLCPYVQLRPQACRRLPIPIYRPQW